MRIKNSMRIILLVVLLLLLTGIGMFVLNQVTSGIGNSVVMSAKAIHDVSQKISTSQNQTSNPIACSDAACEGSYVGPEFINGSDIAHQFSNKMSGKVGDHLKLMFDEGAYSKVDFSNIIMTTDGMGTGHVVFKLKIPFVRVTTKCDAYTSFDHVGGWNHQPALNRRKRELSSLLLPGEKLDISSLKTTSEGLQEYWIQWKNKVKQLDCAKN